MGQSGVLVRYLKEGGMFSTLGHAQLGSLLTVQLNSMKGRGSLKCSGATFSLEIKVTFYPSWENIMTSTCQKK